ncbi:MAG: peptidoglycan-binding protein, partial [Clostridia bacterium]|nr:peptidoglycan-binding protein [Clostridia bacterium]
YYYGDDIEIVTNAPISELEESYPGTPVRLGDTGEAVIAVQRAINEISNNYPAIPKVSVDGIFGESTEDAVKALQSIFNLTPDGVVGLATWYKIVYLYVGIRRLAELNSRGQQLRGISFEYPNAVAIGDTGQKVTIAQFLLSVISEFYYSVPFVAIDGVFGQSTQNAVREFQRTFGLPVTGVITQSVWNAMYDTFVSVDNELTTKDYAAELDRLLNGNRQYQGSRLNYGDSDF